MSIEETAQGRDLLSRAEERAAAAATRRIEAIITSKPAQCRPQLAFDLAIHGTLPAETAIAVLEDAPPEIDELPWHLRAYNWH